MSIHKNNFIALDTSSEIATVVLFDQEKIYFTKSLCHKFSHGQLLCPALDEALDFLNTHNMSLDGVFVGLGPGSFVGLRIALATALGFCFGRMIPLMGFCSHYALAHTWGELTDVTVAMKASGDLCYVTTYGLNQGLTQVISKADIPTILAFDSSLVTNLEFEEALGQVNIISTKGPTAVGVQKACLHRLTNLGKIIDESDYIKPNYVKEPSVSLPSKNKIY